MVSEHFREARILDYLDWLYGYLDNGGEITNAVNCEFPGSQYHVAIKDFDDGIMGTITGDIIVPEEVQYLHRDSDVLSQILGDGPYDRQIYFHDGFKNEGYHRSVPVYSDWAFDIIPGIDKVRIMRSDGWMRHLSVAPYLPEAHSTSGLIGFERFKAEFGSLDNGKRKRFFARAVRAIEQAEAMGERKHADRLKNGLADLNGVGRSTHDGNRSDVRTEHRRGDRRHEAERRQNRGTHSELRSYLSMGPDLD